MKYVLFVLAFISLSAHAQMQEEATQIQKEEICKRTMEELAMSGTVDACIENSTFDVYCGDWCMHGMSNGDIAFGSDTLKFWGSIMIDRDGNLDQRSYYVRRVD